MNYDEKIEEIKNYPVLNVNVDVPVGSNIEIPFNLKSEQITDKQLLDKVNEIVISLVNENQGFKQQIMLINMDVRTLQNRNIELKAQLEDTKRICYSCRNRS